MAVAPFDHAFLSGLLGDAPTARQFSAEADIAAIAIFEAALARAEADEGVIPAAAADAIGAALQHFKPDLEALRAAVIQDGVVVPQLVKQMRAAVGDPHGAHVHFGSTSQDASDTSLVLRLLPVLDDFRARLEEVVVALDGLLARDGAVSVMAHTRMQAAIPVPAARKIESWRDPLLRHATRLVSVREHIGVLHFGGAAGTLDKLGDKGEAVKRRLAGELGLVPLHRPRHTERDDFAELASWLSLVTGSLGKMGQDIALAAQSEVGEIRLATGGGSSAMPHKVNPVGAEMLVTLARFNATLLAGMHQSTVHENERSGAAWTLEWMLLPQMAVATGAALATALRLLPAIGFQATAPRD